jgi:hypothetical protein
LHQRADITPTTRAAIAHRLSVCLPQLPTDALPQVLEITVAPEPAAAAQQLIAWLEDPSALPATRVALRNFITAPQPPAAARLHPARPQLLLWALQHGDGAERLKAIQSCTDTDTPELRAALRSLANSTTDVGELRSAAQRILAQLRDTQYDWHDEIKTLIERAGRNTLAGGDTELIRLLPDEILLPEVSKGLESSTTSTVAGACQLAAILGERAVPVVSKLWQLRDKRAPAIRYAAVLALLQINPMTPELQDHVRLLLVNRFFAQALTRPIQWHRAVAVVDLDKAAFGTLRTVHLERLLA